MDVRHPYYLLLADMQGSSSLSPEMSTALMQRLLAVLQVQNTLNAGALAYPLEVNYGDEFAGLFTAAAPIAATVTAVRAALRGVSRFRFVVAHGRIGYAGASVREMGGPVFETASEALTALKKSGQFGRWLIGDETANIALDALTNAADSLLGEMTDYQYDVYRQQRAGLSGVEIAGVLGKDPRSVSKAKKTGHSATIIDIETAMEALLAAHDRRKAEGMAT